MSRKLFLKSVVAELISEGWRPVNARDSARRIWYAGMTDDGSAHFTPLRLELQRAVDGWRQ